MLIKWLTLTFFIAYFAFTYKLANKQEQVHPQTESSKQFKSLLDHIFELINALYERYVKMQLMRTHKIDTYKNTKIVGWLLNRKSIESESRARKKLWETFHFSPDQQPINDEKSDLQPKETTSQEAKNKSARDVRSGFSQSLEPSKLTTNIMRSSTMQGDKTSSLRKE